MDDSNSPAAGAPDNNLDELLNSSLCDFNKPLPKISTADKKNQNESSSSTSGQEVKLTDTKSTSAESAAWNKEYKQFQDAMQHFIDDGSDLKQEFNNLVESLQPNAESLGGGDNFAETFAETIRGLTEGAQNIPDPTPEELSNLLKDFDLGDGNSLDGDQMPDFMPLMQTVMQNLMSKELLYPSLKDIVDKYPDWLAIKRSSMEEEEYEKYSRQYDLMKEVCEEFESECDNSDDAKKARFEKVLMLMQKIQSYGNPPKELVGELGQGLPLDEHGNLQIPGMPEQCAIM